MTDECTHFRGEVAGAVKHTFSGYQIDVKHGSTARLIVSLAGIGVPQADRPGRPSMALEWNGTFTRLGLHDHVIFLRDLNRSWFNDETGWSDVVAFIEGYCAEHEITERIGFGLSMGGSGLLVLDHDLKFDHAIVMGPQVLLGNEACSFDHRFDDLWAKVETFRYPDLSLTMRADGHFHVLCPIDIPEDVRHVRALVARRADLRVSFVHGDHNIGAEMGRRAALDRFVKALLDRDDDVLKRTGVFDADRRVFELVERAMTEGLSPRLAVDTAAVHQTSPSNVPEFLASMLMDEGTRPASLNAVAVDGADAPVAVVHAAQIIPPAVFPQLARYGWFGLESGSFVWSEGIYHILRLHIMDFADRPETQVVLTVCPLLGEAHRRQILSVAIDGEHVVDTAFSYEAGDAGRPVEVRLPIKRATPEILLTTPLCVSPSSMGLNEDRRLLALQLMGVRLLPF